MTKISLDMRNLKLPLHSKFAAGTEDNLLEEHI